MAGLSIENTPRPDGRKLVAIFPPVSLRPFLNLETAHNLTDRDKWDENPERQRLYWLHNAASYADAHFGQSGKLFTSLPDDCRKIFANGRTDTSIMPFFIGQISIAAIPAHRARIAELLAKIEELVYEKGFRPRADLRTAREHRNIGSTIGRIYTETDPDIPISLLHERLLAAGKIKPHEGEDNTHITIGEVDRARRLSGMTMLVRKQEGQQIR